MQAIPLLTRNYTQIMRYAGDFVKGIALKHPPDPFQDEAFRVGRPDAESGAAPSSFPSLQPMCRISDLHLTGAFDNICTIATWDRNHIFLVRVPGLGQATV